MDNNLSPCASDDAQFDLIQLANPPDANWLFDASNDDAGLDAFQLHEPPDSRKDNVLDKDASHTKPPLILDNAQQSNSNLGSENDQLNAKEKKKKRKIKPNDFTQSILYQTLSPDATLSNEFQALQMPSTYDEDKVVCINSVRHKILGLKNNWFP